MKKYFSKSVLFPLVIGVFGGVIFLLVVRYFTYNPPRVHYHANFAVYINSQREQFKDNFYYQSEASACTAIGNITPPVRAHMHDHINNVIHVHDHAVTWGQYFQNIGWAINPRFVNTPNQLFLADDNHKITFIVNGEVIPNIANQVIGDRDRLLIDYSNETNPQIQAEFKSVTSTAIKYDTNKDPASCSGNLPITTHDRIHHLF